MKKGFIIVLPLIALAIFMSRPQPAPAGEERATPPLERQSPAEEEVKTEALSLAVLPVAPLQGDPLLVEVRGLSGTSTIRALKFKNEPVALFVEGGRVKGLYGLDLRIPPGTYPLTLTLTDGRVIEESVAVAERRMPSAPLGIPEKLGGNTPEAEQELVSTLVEEGKIISAIKSSEERLWSGPFAYPVAPPITITDPYGYSRQTGTGGTTIAHKGTDFRAAVGTPVLAVADGRVSYVGYLRNYGNVVAVDHGTKLLSIYMHLSRVDVKPGALVRKGDTIALSGDTGYVLGPHLHLTIRINNISIDPMKFYSLLGVDKST
jgi:hypothetical protein